MHVDGQAYLREGDNIKHLVDGGQKWDRGKRVAVDPCDSTPNSTHVGAAKLRLSLIHI